MSPELVSSVLGGLVLVIGALGTYAANRSQGVARDRRAHRALQKKFLIAMRFIFRLETELADRGFQPPDRPAALEDDDDEPIAAPPALPPQPTPRPPGPPSGATGDA